MQGELLHVVNFCPHFAYYMMLELEEVAAAARWIPFHAKMKMTIILNMEEQEVHHPVMIMVQKHVKIL